MTPTAVNATDTVGRPGSAASPNLVEARDVRKTFATRDGELPVLEGIDLRVRDGEIVALLGRSGSGKSTLLRVIAGLIPTTDGAVLYRGQPFVGTNPGVGMVFQSFALLPWLTVQQNVELGLEARGMLPAERARRASAHRPDRPGRLRIRLPQGALRRHASARGLRPRAGHRTGRPAHGRALQRARRPHCREPAHRAARAVGLGRLSHQGRAHGHPQHRGGGAFADRVIVLGTNPGRIKAEIAIDLDRPRDRRAPEFEALLDRIYGIMTGREVEAHAAPAATGADRTAPDARPVMLPHASVDGFSGLLEILRDAGGAADLADLSDDLSLEVDDLLPLVDACLMLGFVTTGDGQLALTSDGRRFADADIQQSKQLFADVATERVPLVRTIRLALARADDGALKEAFFLDVLRRHYSADEARAQLDTAIDWGRYGELYEYAADTAEVTRHLDGAGRPAGGNRT